MDKMKISYDPEVDALSIVFRETTVTTKPLGEGIAVEYDRDGRLAGIEVLEAVKRFGDAESLHQVIVEGSALERFPDTAVWLLRKTRPHTGHGRQREKGAVER